jgi:hypothetical protein
MIRMDILHNRQFPSLSLASPDQMRRARIPAYGRDFTTRDGNERLVSPTRLAVISDRDRVNVKTNEFSLVASPLSTMRQPIACG